MVLHSTIASAIIHLAQLIYSLLLILKGSCGLYILYQHNINLTNVCYEKEEESDKDIELFLSVLDYHPEIKEDTERDYHYVDNDKYLRC